MPWGAAIAAAGAIGGALITSNASSDAAKSAANTQANSAAAANAVQTQEFNTVQQNLAPYQQGGGNALAALQAQLGIGPGGTITPNAPLTTPFSAQAFTASPGYNYQLQQGTNAVLNNASATGGVNSGNTLRQLQSVGQGVANQDYWNQYNAYTQRQNTLFNQLFGLTGIGQNAAAGVGNAALSTGNNISQNLVGAGNAQAAGTVGAANASNAGVNNSLPYLLSFAQQFGGASGSSGANSLNGTAFAPSDGGTGSTYPSWY